MSDILRLTIDEARPRTLRGPDAVLDPSTAAIVEAAADSARREGHAQGEAAGRALAREELERATNAVIHALTEVHREIAAQRAVATAASLELARAAADAVLERTPPDEATQLLDRVQEVARVLDGGELRVHVHPDDHVVLCGGLPVPGLTWIEDAAIGAGEARVDGRDCGAEITRAALVTAALEALGEGAL